ncbi:MAG: hypothetical protein ACKO8H_16565, partial [Microcystis panniformis]
IRSSNQKTIHKTPGPSQDQVKSPIFIILSPITPLPHFPDIAWVRCKKKKNCGQKGEMEYTKSIRLSILLFFKLHPRQQNRNYPSH